MNSFRFKKKIVGFGSSKFRFKPLMTGKVSNSGRNVTSVIVTRGRSSGVKSNYFSIDYSRIWTKKLAVSINLLKYPKKSSFISLIKYSNGTFSYILASSTLKPGDLTLSTALPIMFLIKIGDVACNVLLKYVSYTSLFFNIELLVGSGGKYARSAGTFCRLLSVNLNKDIIKISLPSGVVKIVSQYCMVTLGRSSNLLHSKQFLVKAGYYRNLGFKSKVRGVAMNPIDHPHGGRTKTNSPELTPWGKIAKINK